MLRDTLLHKARTALVVLAVATGLVGTGALLDTSAILQQVTQRTYGASFPVEATMRLDRIDADLVDAVRALPEIAAVRTRRTLAVSAQGGGASRHALLFALDDFTRADIGKLQSESGDWPPRDGEIIVERSSLEFSGANVGDSLSLTREGVAPVSLPVRGVVRDVSQAPGWMENVVYGFVTPATLATFGVPAQPDELQFRVRDPHADRAAIRDVAAKVKALAQARGYRVTHLDVPVPGQHIHAAQMESLTFTQTAFAALALFASCLLVVNLVGAMLAGQVREIAIMKSFGAAPAQITGLYLAFAFAAGAIASVIALPAAVAIGNIYAKMKADMLNFPIGDASVPIGVLALQVLIGCVLPMAAAAIPVWRGVRLPVADGLRDQTLGAFSDNESSRHRIRIAPRVRAAIANPFRRRARLVLTLLTLAAGGTVFLGAANLRAAVIASVDQLFSGQHFDFTLRLAGSADVARVETIAAAVDGVARVQAWSSVSATRVDSGTDAPEPMTLVGVPPQSDLFAPTVIEGRWLAAAANELVISRALQRTDASMRVGATVTLTIEDKPAQWTIVGVIETGPAMASFASRDVLAALRGRNDAASLAVATRTMASQIDVIARLRTALADQGIGVAGSQRVDEMRRVFSDHLLMVIQFLGAMGWVMLVIGGMGLAATMSIAVLERTREIGVLRAIGAAHRHIIALTLGEGVVIAILAWLVAIPLSVPVSVVLSDAFGRIMFAVPTRYVPELGGVVTWLAISVSIAVVASAWPALRAVRIPVARALAFE